MSKKNTLPETLIEAVRYFSDEDVCVQFVAELRWPDGWACPVCGCMESSYLTTRRLWKCRACKKQTSVKVGTIFEDSPLGLDKWLVSIWLIANSKNGISSHELGRSVGITQKSAWFVLQRIRLAMQTGTFEKLSGPVEADETYVGGKRGNKHLSQREKFPPGGYADKTIVAGVLERDGEARATVVPFANKWWLTDHIERHVEPGSTLYTDEHPSYRHLGDRYDHATIDHGVEYVSGQVHTNGIENFWSLLKRSLTGTYVSVQPSHLFRYVDERVYAFNNRELDDLPRFAGVVQQVTGRRLTWNGLTGQE